MNWRHNASKAAVSMSVTVALVAFRPRPTSATTYLGWADKFVQANVSCRTYQPGSGYQECSIYDFWNDSLNWMPPTWEYVGVQGANSTGRTNAEEEVNFQFRDDDSGSYTATVTLARYRTTTPPPEYSDCTGGTFVGSTSYTISSTGFSGSDHYIENRRLPVMNFSAETAGAGTVIGYRSAVSVQWDNGGTPVSFSTDGCFDIFWST